MRKICILAITLSCTLFGLAQKGKFSGALSFPIPIGDNFVNENYKGIIDLGAQYRFFTTEFFNLGASVNASFYEFENENFTVQPDINARFIQPRVFGELHVGRLRVQVGGGYTFTSFRTENALGPGQTEKVRDNSEGPNANAAISFDVFKGLFVMAQYDYIKIDTFGSLADNDFNKQIDLVKLGLGYRF
ncbi:outer membrane beta-barrel protein [Flavobacteriaceae bacterium 3-367]|uniref:outer membrane protein n=1 Tax=Eudoraea algarum TaxID=3417568 RepID=UPI00328C7DBF